MNYYEILGVGPDATDLVIKGAYRREAMKWHPDRHEGVAAKGEADRRFKDLAVAYRTLRNPAARADYDRQLEQQLRREYEARQQEQARQQRAQSEQAQREQTRQQQARPEPPKDDFQDTKPQFEKETASADDANQMFYEQMLDLAFELAGRGFPEFNIYKALIALGCPDALAKVVAATAAKPGQRGQDGTSSKAQNTTSSPSKSNVEYVVKPKRLLAILGAIFGLWLIYQCISAWSPLNSIWHILIQLAAGIFGSRLLIHWGQVSIANTLMIIDRHGIRFSRGSGKITKWTEINRVIFDGKKLIIGGLKDGKKWEEQLPKMFISGDCQEIVLQISKFSANASTGIGFSSDEPIGSGRGLTTIAINTSIAIALVGILAAVALPAYQDYTRKARVAEGIVAGMEAGKKIGDYYVQNKKGPTDLVNAGFSLQPSETVKDIAFDSQTGVITIKLRDSFFTAKSLLFVPTVTDGKVNWLCTSDGIASQYLPQSCRATQADADAKLAAMKTESQAEDQAKAEYAQALAAIEKKYPELNPDSPSYNSKSLDWVAARKSIHQKGGQSPTNALQLAVSDYVAAVQQNQSSQSNMQPESAPPIDPYISYIRSLPIQEARIQTLANMNVKFPMINGNLSYAKGDFNPEHFDQAKLVELTQNWGFNRAIGPQSGFIVFQNRAGQPIKGIVLEIQAEERECDNKGKVYFMNLVFERPVPSSVVIGVNFQFPNVIKNANRCMDVVDLIY